jgi:1-pyrroline-5-carboxylate dehydrogenase
MSEKVTYSTFTRDETHRNGFLSGLESADSWLANRHPFYVDGQPREGSGFEDERSPNDREVVVGAFGTATLGDLDEAILSAAKKFRSWSQTPWVERVRIVRKVAHLVAERRFDLAAVLAWEVGKPCLEAIGEVDECVDLVNYYCDQMEHNEGFVRPMGHVSPGERARSVLRPYGVWGVIGPFNFPMALTLGPASAALIAGNTVVLKPSPHAYLSGLNVYKLFIDAGIPEGALHLVTIPDAVLGDHLQRNPRVSGLTFTGSRDVGMRIYRQFALDYPRPLICEMGGKNPAIVTAKADLAKAAAGVARSAMSFAGQRCSACSRVYVEESVYDEFLPALVREISTARVGTPVDVDSDVGPVIDERAVARYQRAVEVAQSEGRVVTGGRRLTANQLDRGYFVEPTVVEVPLESELFRNELFVPFAAVHAVGSLEEALERSNALVFGLTAGLYSEDQTEIERFMDQIDAGVIYINRAAGATSGAWPGVQPFGGWKGSGSSGRAAGGPHYLQQYMHEQSQTIVDSD